MGIVISLVLVDVAGHSQQHLFCDNRFSLVSFRIGERQRKDNVLLFTSDAEFMFSLMHFFFLKCDTTQTLISRVRHKGPNKKNGKNDTLLTNLSVSVWRRMCNFLVMLTTSSLGAGLSPQ